MASEAVVSLVSRYKKAHLHKKWRIVVIFLMLLQAFVNELWLMKNIEERKKEEQMNNFVAALLS